MKTKLLGIMALCGAFFASTSATSVTKAAPINPTEVFEAESSIGGYRVDKNTKKKVQIIGFGFTVKSSVSLDNYSDYGVEVYGDESCESFIEYREKSDIDALKSKNGRFYAIFDCSGGSSFNPGTKYYAKGYLKNPDGTTYSSVISATSNLTTQYSIPE